MYQIFRSAATVVLAVLVAITLTACGSLSKNIEKSGMSAEQLVWPDPGSTTPMHDKGSWPSFGSLQRIQAGMTKNQIAGLIGPPHFGEGIIYVREWNYLFNFATDEGDTVCQYKVLFDKDALARSFYWKPKSCAGLLKGKNKSQKIVLSNDALFYFDSDQMVGNGYVELDKLAAKIVKNEDNIKSVQVAAYSDRLGSDSYNRVLSQKRADAVANYLKNKGVPASQITAIGLGETSPITSNCSVSLSHEKQAACLAPDRRVEIKAYGN